MNAHVLYSARTMNMPHTTQPLSTPQSVAIPFLSVLPFVLAFGFGVLVSKCAAHPLQVARFFRSCDVPRSSNSEPTRMEDRGCQTEFHEPNASSHEDPNGITVELDDLSDLEAHIYERVSRGLFTPSTQQLISEDSVLRNAVSVILQTFGERVPASCIPARRTFAGGPAHDDDYLPQRYSWCVPPIFKRTNGDYASSQAQEDFNEMEALLQIFICRYAVVNSKIAILEPYLRRIPLKEVFGLFKVAVDKDNLDIFQILLGQFKVDESNPELRLPAVFEYAALRGCLSTMKELHEVGISADGDEETHPLSAAVAGGSIEAVELLLEWGARLNDRDRKSIVKQYTQSLIVIAARHENVAMVKYLLGAGAKLRDDQAEYDPLFIAARDSRVCMILCLVRSGITFTRVDPPLEYILGLAVEQHNIELAALMLEAGADPNTEEHCIRYGGVNSFFGTLFQWACVARGEDMVRLFLDHGVDFDRPVQSWVNWKFDKPIYVASCAKQPHIIKIILEYYDEADLVQFAGSLVTKGHWFIFEHCVELEPVRRQSSWLLNKCLSRLHQMSSEKTFPALTGEGYTLIIKALLDMGAWLPPTTTWHLSSVVPFWLGYKTLDDFLVACAKRDHGYQGLSKEFVFNLQEHYKFPGRIYFKDLARRERLAEMKALRCSDLVK